MRNGIKKRTNIKEILWKETCWSGVGRQERESTGDQKILSTGHKEV
jgi:hypothetical protein